MSDFTQHLHSFRSLTKFRFLTQEIKKYLKEALENGTDWNDFILQVNRTDVQEAALWFHK